MSIHEYLTLYTDDYLEGLKCKRKTARLGKINSILIYNISDMMN